MCVRACNVCTEGQSLNLPPSGDLDLECMSMRNYILGWGGGGGSNMQVVDTSGMACAIVEQKEVDRGVGLEKHGTLCGAVKWYGGGCGAGA